MLMEYTNIHWYLETQNLFPGVSRWFMGPMKDRLHGFVATLSGAFDY